MIDRVKPLGVPSRNFNPTLMKKYYGTGNETGEQGRYAEQITRFLSPIWVQLGVGIYMADRSEKSKAPEEKEKARKGKKAAKKKEEEYNSGDNSPVPDLIMLTDDDEGTIRIVGEMKFHLTS